MIPKAWIKDKLKKEWTMPKIEISEQVAWVLVVGIFCTCIVFFTREMRGCTSDTDKGIANCIESGGDAYLCCVNFHSNNNNDCDEQEKYRKVRRVGAEHE